MAAYAATITLDFPTPGAVGNTKMGLLSGTCNLTNYNSTLVELTSITGRFLPNGKLRVVAGGLSSNGYVIKWDSSSKAFRAYRTAAQTVTPSGSITASAPTITTTTNAGTTEPVYTNGGALTQTTGATGITGVQAPTITDARTFAGAAGALAQSANDANVGTFDFIAVGQLG